jgi:hypothetical protein
MPSTLGRRDVITPHTFTDTALASQCLHPLPEGWHSRVSMMLPAGVQPTRG